MRKFVLSFVVFFYGLVAMATHQRAGEISFEHVAGLTYRFTIVTYTYTPSPADREELEINWGDATSSMVARVRKVNLDNDISVNTYITEHTYPSTGTYAITLEDPNRNAGIVNIPNSVNIPFFLETILIINPFLGSNSSPQLLNPPIDDGCVGAVYYHNPGAYDTDGDSLSYSLVSCRGFDGEVIPGYSLPSASHSISIDPVTGDLIWDSPLMQGEYNIAILIQEWRHGVLIGSMVRDMQINIVACNNDPPVITTIDDTCVTAGESLDFLVRATDVNSTSVMLSATGGVFHLATSPARFGLFHGAPPISGTFHWDTECAHVRRTAYNVLFKVVDNGPQVNLTAYKTVNITVVAPQPEIVEVVPIGNEVHLRWKTHHCSNAVGYRIYRRQESYDFEPSPCETGLPSYTGYQLIGTNTGYTDTAFVDNGGQLPLNHGTQYCYRVVAFFADGAESYASEEWCTTLLNDVPRLTHVDVDLTDVAAGAIFLQWLPPTELDTIRFPGPHYEYRLYRSLTPNFSQAPLIQTFYSLMDTVYYDLGLNTVDERYYYLLELWAQVGDSLVRVGCSDPASSVYLTLNELDRSIELQWNESVPWFNKAYVIYRYDESVHQFLPLDTVDASPYIDGHLQNGISYCYYVMALGGYFSPDTVGIFLNRSQQACGVPADITPPEIPDCQITSDCEQVNFLWHFSNDSAYNDVYKYFIYYKPTHTEPYVIIDSFSMNEDCFYGECAYQLMDLPYIIGCFAMGAVDTAGNYSDHSSEFCFDWDACNPYHLPNVFTPNGDGVNDIFQPFPYDNVQKIEMYIYDRWGQLVFKTEDPDIQWTGTDMHTHRPSSDGTYYYACKVYVYSLNGVITKELHGTITLLR